MSKLPRNIKGTRLLKALSKLGFQKDRSAGSHVIVAHQDGRWTQVSTHPKPIPQGTLRAILTQAQITVEELLKAY